MCFDTRLIEAGNASLQVLASMDLLRRVTAVRVFFKLLSTIPSSKVSPSVHFYHRPGNSFCGRRTPLRCLCSDEVAAIYVGRRPSDVAGTRASLVTSYRLGSRHDRRFPAHLGVDGAQLRQIGDDVAWVPSSLVLEAYDTRKDQEPSFRCHDVDYDAGASGKAGTYVSSTC